jgi:hypothetical protein
MAAIVLIGCLLIGIYLALLAFSIVTVHSGSTMAIEPKLEIIQWPDIPVVVQPYFRQLDETLEAVSFKPVFYLLYLQHPASTELTGYIRFFVNDVDRDTAMVSVLLQKMDRRVSVKSYCEYLSDYRNGCDILTNNNSQPSIYNKKRSTLIQKYPKVADPVRLYEIHKHRCASLNIASEKTIPMKGHELDYILSALKKDIQMQVKNGFYVLDAVHNVYQLTWKGAILFTLKIFHFSRWWETGAAVDESDAGSGVASEGSRIP